MADSGFEAMGKPIPDYRRDAAYAAARSMGLSAKDAMSEVGRMADSLERDKPNEALLAGFSELPRTNVVVDLTGRYRLIATLLTAREEAGQALIEYALIVALVVVVAALTLGAFTRGVNGVLDHTSNELACPYGMLADGTCVPAP